MSKINKNILYVVGFISFIITVVVIYIFTIYSPSLKSTQDDLNKKLSDMLIKVNAILKINSSCIDKNSILYAQLINESSILNTDIINFNNKSLVSTLSDNSSELTTKINDILSKLNTVNCIDYCKNKNQNFDGSICVDITNASLEEQILESNNILKNLTDYISNITL